MALFSSWFPPHPEFALGNCFSKSSPYTAEMFSEKQILCSLKVWKKVWGFVYLFCLKKKKKNILHLRADKVGNFCPSNLSIYLYPCKPTDWIGLSFVWEMDVHSLLTLCLPPLWGSTGCFWPMNTRLARSFWGRRKAGESPAGWWFTCVFIELFELEGTIKGHLVQLTKQKSAVLPKLRFAPSSGLLGALLLYTVPKQKSSLPFISWSPF